MTTTSRAFLSLALASALSACSGAPHTPEAGPAPSQAPAAAPLSLEERRASISGEEAAAYARRLAPMLVSRTLAADELSALEATGGAGLPLLLAQWVEEPGFEDAARMWISLKLKASGKRGDIDLDLPGNLAAYLVREELPYSEILKADYCVDASGAKRACDTGAPYAAGVLATRAFLSNNAGRFNLKRARTTMTTFACNDYPMEQALQPSLARDVLIPLFQQDKVETSDGSGAFGNGFACYSCHSQFGAHAQVFVKFDKEGRFVEDASGQQDPTGEPGASVSGLFTSHMIDPARARREDSQVFGRPVVNLSEAARSIAESERFLPCAVRSLVGFGFSVADSVTNSIDPAIVSEVVDGARAAAPDPTLRQLAIHAFSHPAIVRSMRGEGGTF